MRDKAGTGEDEGEALMKLGFTKVEEKRGFQKRSVCLGMSSLLFRAYVIYPSLIHSLLCSINIFKIPAGCQALL